MRSIGWLTLTGMVVGCWLGACPVKAQPPSFPCDITQPGVTDTLYICITDTIYVITVRDTTYVNEDKTFLMLPGAAVVTFASDWDPDSLATYDRTWCSPEAIDAGEYVIYGGITGDSDQVTIWTLQRTVTWGATEKRCFSLPSIFDKVMVMPRSGEFS